MGRAKGLPGPGALMSLPTGLLLLLFVTSVQCVPKTCATINTDGDTAPISCSGGQGYEEVKLNCTSADSDSNFEIHSNGENDLLENVRNDPLVVPSKQCFLEIKQPMKAMQCLWDCFGKKDGIWEKLCSIDARRNASCPVPTVINIAIPTTFDPETTAGRTPAHVASETSGTRSPSEDQTTASKDPSTTPSRSSTPVISASNEHQSTLNPVETSPKHSSKETGLTKTDPPGLNYTMLLFIVFAIILIILGFFGAFRCAKLKGRSKEKALDPQRLQALVQFKPMYSFPHPVTTAGKRPSDDDLASSQMHLINTPAFKPQRSISSDLDTTIEPVTSRSPTAGGTSLSSEGQDTDQDIAPVDSCKTELDIHRGDCPTTHCTAAKDDHDDYNKNLFDQRRSFWQYLPARTPYTRGKQAAPSESTAAAEGAPHLMVRMQNSDESDPGEQRHCEPRETTTHVWHTFTALQFDKVDTDSLGFDDVNV